MNETNQKWKIGDCQDLMQELEPDSVDLVVTDPPYGYSFMGKDWDKVVPSVEIWKKCLRVLKPGAFAFIMSAPRQDVLAHNLVNLSDAGFDTGFTSIYWTFASGFPKSNNIGKMVDKRLGAEREILGFRSKRCSTPTHGIGHGIYGNSKRDGSNSTKDEVDGFRYATAPATPQAKALDGSYAGFQPKPAVEIIMVAMKPLSESTYVDQAIENQKGITWLDDGRIPYQSESDKGDVDRFKGVPMLPPEKGFNQNKVVIDVEVGQNGGRFPANLLVSDDVLNDGTISCHKRNGERKKTNKSIFGIGDKGEINAPGDSGSFSRYFDLDAWWTTQIINLPKEAQKTFPFLITPKASKSEKGTDCTHPTVKPVKLFSWLITIGSRKDDLILDPFLGSGTTLEAGRFTGRRVMGFEISGEWEHLYPGRCMAHQPPLSNYI